MKINISIIIPVYKAVNSLKNSLNSIKNQNIDLEKKIEIILVIDDGKNYKDIVPKFNKNMSIRQRLTS